MEDWFSKHEVIRISSFPHKMKLSTVLFTAFLINCNAVLDPPCGSLTKTPQCTFNRSEVSPTLPICSKPVSEYLQCRGIPGMKDIPKGGIVPTWFDYNYARRGQEVSSEYRLPWYYNMFNGLLVEMIIPDILHPLLFNKKNTDGNAAAKRDLATILQGIVWTKDYLRKMPEEGHSTWIQSIRSVRQVHKDVQLRGYYALQTTGCLVDLTDYAHEETDDISWDAFQKDVKSSDILIGRRELSPATLPTCPDITTCSDCSSLCSTNCADVCAEDSAPTEFAKSFGPGQINTLSLVNVVLKSSSLEDGTSVDGVYSSVVFSDNGHWVSGTSSSGTVYKAGQMQGGVIETAEVIVGRYMSKLKISGGLLTTGVFANGMLISGNIKESSACNVLYQNCSECQGCKDCGWKPPTCYHSNPATFNCETCRCDINGKTCTNCTGCVNYTKCLNFTIPLYNQQALSFVVFNIVGFAILWPKEVGITACDADMWALNHLWAGILYALGVEDECNILLMPDIRTARIYYREIFDTYLLPTLFDLDKPTRFMMDNVFKGLKILTGTAFTPRLLLCRFLRDFLQIPAHNTCDLLDIKDRLFDSAVTGMMIPQFMNDTTYRAVVNKEMDDKFVRDAKLFFPGGQCENYERISKECLV